MNKTLKTLFWTGAGAAAMAAANKISAALGASDVMI